MPRYMTSCAGRPLQVHRRMAGKQKARGFLAQAFPCARRAALPIRRHAACRGPGCADVIARRFCADQGYFASAPRMSITRCARVPAQHARRGQGRPPTTRKAMARIPATAHVAALFALAARRIEHIGSESQLTCHPRRIACGYIERCRRRFPRPPASETSKATGGFPAASMVRFAEAISRLHARSWHGSGGQCGAFAATFVRQARMTLPQPSHRADEAGRPSYHRLRPPKPGVDVRLERPRTVVVRAALVDGRR